MQVEIASTPSSPGGAAPAPVPRVSTLRKVIPFVVAAALLGLVAYRIDFRAFGAALRSLDLGSYLAFALAWQIALLAADALGNFAAYRLTMPSVRYRDFYVFRAASYLPGMVNHHLGQAYLTYLFSRLAKLPLARVAGATLVSYAAWMGCLLGCFAIAIPIAGMWLGYPIVIVAGGLVYLAIIFAKPAALDRITFLKPLFEAGLKGHAIALVARIPHLLVLVLGTWAGYLFFHVDIPLGTALVYLPIILVAATLPLTPQGFGTREALALGFFAPFAQGATDPEKNGRITAATTTWGVSVTLAGIVVSLICSRIVANRLKAIERAGSPE